ncbi:MAG: energy transducer TonB [candidate division Zixibacteria bacterium]|nr:energy transducer TonB [candidate division Zixibacteria bacterium]MDH3938738.1 energy transducer TonB [candidate division Zixibacteria bacterium]MDH4033312.1 energy transducer TonB [candidate division Zixibacteria bacterium]
MTGHYQTAVHANTPTLFRETTAFLMKANYQRHMLYGWAVALVVVLVPVLVISLWPAEKMLVIERDATGKDTVSVNLFFEQYEIIKQRPGQSGGSNPPPKPGMTGPFVDDVTLVEDDLDIEQELELGQGGEYEDGSFDDYDPFAPPGGGGGTVYKPDTRDYEPNSPDLDRPPVFIAMDQPEYPPLARRAEVEAEVIIHILVDAAGKVAEVRVEKVTNPNFGFAESAIRAAKSAVFSPAIANHQPVRCWVAIPVRFEME